MVAQIEALPDGPDVSHWEGEPGPYQIDWEQAEPEIAFAIDKATEGTGWVDNAFAYNQGEQIRLDIPWGGYHFFLPGYSPVQQAQHFYSTVGSGTAFYCCDLETSLLQMAAKRTGKRMAESTVARMISESRRAPLDAALAFHVKTIIDQTCGSTPLIELARQFLETLAGLTGYKPVLYTSPWFWNTFCQPYPDWTDFVIRWVAHYTEAAQPMLPNGWPDWTLWQYTDRGRIPGIRAAVDRNRFNGSADEVRPFFFEGQKPVSPPIPRYVIVNVPTLNLRSTPGTELPEIGKTTADKRWEVIGEEVDAQGRKWYKLACYAAGWLVRE